MAESVEVKPYLVRIKKWKVRNMVMLFIEAREQFKSYYKLLRRGNELSFEKLREISEILFEIKEDHHLLYKRLRDPKKKKFEKANKFTPDKVEIEFMNNIGLLFHKMMVVRELKYVMEHYVEQSTIFQRNQEILNNHLNIINELFDEGIEVLKLFIRQNRTNVLLLTLLLENPSLTKRHFGGDAGELLRQLTTKGIEDIYYKIGNYYRECGRNEQAQKMFKSVLKRDSGHKRAKQALANLA